MSSSSTMERWLIGTYSGSLKERLRSFDFQHYQKKVPWHILGFSVDFKHTIKAIDRYLDGVDEKDEKDKDAEWNQWNSLSPQKKKEYEDCIKLLKTQQAMLKQPMEQLLPSFVAAVADSGSVSTAVHGPTIQVTPVTSFSGMFDGLSGNNVDAESSHPKKDPAAPYPNPSEWLPDSDDDDSFGTRYRWTEAEEMKLDIAVEKYVSEGLRPKWNLISAEMFGGKRTPAQLAQQWEMQHKPGTVRGNWQPHEDKIIMQMAAQGSDFATVAAKLPGRTSTLVGRRFHHLMKPVASTSTTKVCKKKKAQDELSSPKKKRPPQVPWTKEEISIVEANLNNALTRKGARELALLLPGRTIKAIVCRAYDIKKAHRHRLLLSTKGNRAPNASADCTAPPVNTANLSKVTNLLGSIAATGLKQEHNGKEDEKETVATKKDIDTHSASPNKNSNASTRFVQQSTLEFVRRTFSPTSDPSKGGSLLHNISSPGTSVPFDISTGTNDMLSDESLGEYDI